MPHVSRKKISEKVLQNIFRALVHNVSRANETKDALLLVHGLLTKTERIMLAKRLAAIHLLSKGISVRKVSEILGLSISTAQRFLAATEFKRIAQLVLFLERRNSHFWKNIEYILRAGLPPQGHGRWYRIYRLIEK
jgi:Trp operon repressor